MKGKKMKSVNVLWVSRHPPNYTQTQELEKVYGHIHTIQISETVKDGFEVKELMEKYGAEEAVVVLPINIIAQLTQMGISPLRAVMYRHKGENGEPIYQHSHFEIVRSVKIITEPLLEE